MRRIRKMKWSQGVLLVLNIVLFIFSWSLFGYIGPEGLLSFLLFMASGGYLTLFVYLNWGILTK